VSNSYGVAPERVQIGAGTALKFGFFVAFGVFLFYLILSIVLAAVAIALALFGAIDINDLLPG
jgi:hypothetical protein